MAKGSKPAASTADTARSHTTEQRRGRIASVRTIGEPAANKPGPASPGGDDESKRDSMRTAGAGRAGQNVEQKVVRKGVTEFPPTPDYRRIGIMAVVVVTAIIIVIAAVAALAFEP